MTNDILYHCKFLHAIPIEYSITLENPKVV